MAEHGEDAVLITGASAGIGLSFAHAYAQIGKNLILVARREAPLRDTAQALAQRYGVTSTALTADLADPETPERLFHKVNGMGIHIEGLVNNAGFGVPGHLCDVEWHRHKNTIEAMATAPVHLTRLFTPAMIQRRRGQIVFVSSLSALLPPHAGGTLYYPVKSFLYQFSLAMHEELRNTGVHVTVLCPGFTVTDFQKAAGGTVESVAVPGWMWSKPEVVVKAAIAAVNRNQAVCIPGVVNKGIALAFKLMPRAFGRWIVRV